MLGLEVIEALTNDVEFIDLAGDFGVKLIPLSAEVNYVL
jgi:hypothetical protein